MRKLVTMREALTSPDYYGTYLAGPTWDAWRVMLISIMGEPLTETERVTFTALTGRATEPTEPVKEFWGIIGRRGGKSRATAVLASYLAACVDHRDALAPGEVGTLPILAASRGQAAQLFNFVSGIFESVPAFHGMVTDATADTLRLITGVNVVITSASWRTVRSITAISAIGDEVAFWRSDESANPDAEIIGALKPALLTTGGMFVGISSPYAQRGEVWKAFKRHHGPDGDPRKLVAQAASLTMNPGLPTEEIEAAYAEDPAAASAEFGGQFRTDVDSFISIEVLNAVTDKGVFERPWMGQRHVAAVDPAGGTGGGDSMTMAIAHHEGQVAILDLVREVKPPFSTESVVAEFAATMKGYGIKRVTGDRWGGAFCESAFQRHGIRYDHSDKVRSDIYLEVLPLISSNRVRLIDNPTMAYQFTNLERRVGRNGKDSIDHPPGRKSHDDLCNVAALALTLAAFQKPRMTPEQHKKFQFMAATLMAR